VTLIDIEQVVVPRDRWGRPQLLPKEAFGPDGTVLLSDKLPKRIGLQRVTTLSKAAESTDSLTGWACRMTLIGAASRPDIIASTQATDSDDRKALDALVEKAKELGGANQRRELGTAVHKFFERKTIDPTYEVPDAYAADVDAILAAIDAAGFDIVTEHSEQMVAIYAIGCAGTPDLILRERSTGLYYIGDLKTGASVAYGTLGWATQLSVYSMADAFYVHGADADGRDDRLVSMPDVSRDRGVIIHCEPGSGHADLYWLTLSAQFVDLAVAIRQMRKRRDLLTKFEGGDATSTAGTVEVVGSVEDNQPTVAAPVTDSGGTVSSSPESAIHHQADVAWLINRTTSLVAATSKQHVAQVWPVDIARPGDIKAGTATWDAGDIDVICIALDALEAKNDLPFGDPRPSIAADLAARFDDAITADRTPPPRLTPAPDDDGPAPDEYVAELKRLAGEMQTSPDADVRARIARAQLWQRDANTADVPWRTGLGPAGSTPMRVWAIGRAAIAATALVDLTADDPDAAVRALLETYCGDNAHRFSVGALFGALTTDQAIAIWDMAGDNK
jgi:hypothetical protein